MGPRQIRTRDCRDCCVSPHRRTTTRWIDSPSRPVPLLFLPSVTLAALVPPHVFLDKFCFGLTQNP